MKSKLFMLIIAPALLALVVGCGSGSSEPEQEAEGLGESSTSIWAAVARGDTELIERRLAEGADINERFQEPILGFGGTPLHIAVLSNQAAAAEFLVAKGADLDVKAGDGFGGTPLHWAIIFAEEQLAQILIEAGADVNAPDNFGDTPLDATAFEFDREDTEEQKEIKLKIAELLRENGAVNKEELPPPVFDENQEPDRNLALPPDTADTTVAFI